MLFRLWKISFIDLMCWAHMCKIWQHFTDFRSLRSLGQVGWHIAIGWLLMSAALRVASVEYTDRNLYILWLLVPWGTIWCKIVLVYFFKVFFTPVHRYDSWVNLMIAKEGSINRNCIFHDSQGSGSCART